MNVSDANLTNFRSTLTALSGETKVAGIVGWPVAHSLSPRLHGYWLRKYGIDGTYVPFPVRPELLATALGALPALGLVGVNLTVPHKEKAMAVMDKISPLARRIGAINTVIVDTDGGIFGDNTDAYGFLANVRASLPGWTAAQGPAVVLGAGGAARATVAALIDDGSPEIRLVNRSQSRASHIAANFAGPVTVVSWDRRADVLAGARLLVNTTTLGMVHQPPLDMDLSALPDDAVVCDMVYAPLKTDLLATASARGNPVVDGLGMLLHQARPAFAAWFGVHPEVTEDVRAFVLEGLTG
jgi:shikimate dehydrogenase